MTGRGEARVWRLWLGTGPFTRGKRDRQVLAQRENVLQNVKRGERGTAQVNNGGDE